MDFRNLCQKIDVDSIRAKMPQLPAMTPTLPQLKMPKSITKLKSRKIFRSSREDVSGSGKSAKSDQRQQQQQQQQILNAPALNVAHSEFINRTPTRISTISSLVHQQHARTEIRIVDEDEEITYRSAHSIEDDYPSPTQYHGGIAHARTSPTSPTNPSSSEHHPQGFAAAATNSSSSSNKLSLAAKLQRSYKDLTEFKLKHLFAKKTIVRKDDISVAQYVARYDEERHVDEREEERRNAQIADNYRFRFKVSRQDTDQSDSIGSPTSNDSKASSSMHSTTTMAAAKRVSTQSGDESGMEVTPPPHKPGIAATRFARVRNPPLRLSVSDEETEAAAAASVAAVRTPKALWSVKINRAPIDASLEGDQSGAAAGAGTAAKGMKGYKERLKRLTSYVSSSHEDSGSESAAGMLSKLRQMDRHGSASAVNAGETKRKTPLTPEHEHEHEHGLEARPPLGGIKQNFKRLQKSFKRSSGSLDETEDEAKKGTTTREKLAARLRRLKSHDTDDTDAEAKEEGPKSPVRAAIASRLQTLKKSLKRKNAPSDDHTGDEISPGKQRAAKTPSALIKKLNYMRSRKASVSTDDIDAVDEGQGQAQPKGRHSQQSEHTEGRFEKARQRTLKKVNDKMQQMRFFHRSQEQVGMAARPEPAAAPEEGNGANTVANTAPAVARRALRNGHHSDGNESDNDDDDDDEDDDGDDDGQAALEEMAQLSLDYAQGARTSWSTEPVLGGSMDSDAEPDFPRVLIHQDHTDGFESTLIIAVTRPPPSPASATPSPKITELPPDTPVKGGLGRRSASPRPANWIPNKDIISSFLEMTPPSKRKGSAGSQRDGSRHPDSGSASDSDSDAWLPVSVRSQQLQVPGGKEHVRRPSTAGMLNLGEGEESAWRVHTRHSLPTDEQLYKAKSIDIFERNTLQGGVQTAFEDFEDALKNAPVLKIERQQSPHTPALGADADTDTDTLLKVKLEAVQNGAGNAPKPSAEAQLRQLGNSAESLVANIDESEELEDASDDDDGDSDDDDDGDRPPSEAPSRPPSHSPPPPPTPPTSPPLPPLPQRRTSMRRPNETPPPLPSSKPPLPPLPPCPPPLNRPAPNVSERTMSMSRPSKPLVKTSSLRLAFEEQVQPSDVGKVNKLISRFEHPPTKFRQRPRLVPRRTRADESDDCSDHPEDADEDNDNDDDDGDHQKRRGGHCRRASIERDITPTPTNTPTRNSPTCENGHGLELSVSSPPPPLIVTSAAEVNAISSSSRLWQRAPEPEAHPQDGSGGTSEYGSPQEYPSSLMGSVESTPTVERRQALQNARRNRRSMTRDEDNFYSFDSDDENSYYSISSSGSNRYVVEL